jgi:hypothetical protein
VDGDSIDNPQVTVSVFNKYVLSVSDKTLPQDNITTTAAATTTTTTTITTTTTTTNNNNNNGINHKTINIVAPLTVIHHTIWLMPLTTPFLKHNSNFQKQRKSKA